MARFGEAFYRPLGECGPRIQPGYQIVLLVSGSMHVSINRGSPIEVPPNYAILMCPEHEEHYRFSRTTTSHHTWIDLSPTLIHSDNVMSGPKPASETLKNIINMGFKTQNHDFLNALAVAGFHALSDAPQTNHHVRQPVELATEYMRINLSRPFLMEDVAAAAFVSSQHLSKLFKLEIGATPARYLWKIRTERGLELLRSTGLSIQEISLQTGFATPFHFSRCVKEATGHSPRSLRKIWWNLPINPGPHADG